MFDSRIDYTDILTPLSLYVINSYTWIITCSSFVRKAEEVFVQPTNRFGNRDKKALYDERDMLKKRAMTLGKGKEFNLLWHGWVVEYKSDPLKFHLFKDQVKELLGE